MGSETRAFGQGDSDVLPAGFQGLFEIVEAASKLYVVTERA